MGARLNQSINEILYAPKRQWRPIIDPLTETAKQAISRVRTVRGFRDLLQSHDDSAVVAALILIGSHKIKSLRDDLLGITCDRTRNNDVRWQASSELSGLGGPALASVLVERVMTNDLDSLAIERVCYVMGFVSNRLTPRALLSVLEDEAQPIEVRAQAAESIGHCIDIHSRYIVVDSLIRTLQHDSAELRFWCSFALGATGSARAAPALNALAQSDHRLVPGWWTVSKEATDAIERIGPRS